MIVRHAYFGRKLATPITPKMAPGTNLRTLEDCAVFVGKMHRKRQTRPHWQYTAQLILVAARTGKREDVDAAGAQVERALQCDGWL
jgi:hypothetical protein